MSKTSAARSLLRAFAQSNQSCPHHAHGNQSPLTLRSCSSAIEDKESAFEMIYSTMRFGVGVTKEIGLDLCNIGAKKTMLLTDENVVKTTAFQTAAESLTKHNVSFTVFDQVRVEPTDKSVQEAIEAARNGGFDSFIAVGGGSTIDTAKCASLLTANKTSDFWDYVCKPYGEECAPSVPMLPLIAVPTTAGTGSETTCTAVFDIDQIGVKSAIRSRMIKPHLAIVDPLNLESMPRSVSIYTGFDVLCHALESFTARPFHDRPAVLNPAHRPVYQGGNPISDVWSQHALQIMNEFFIRSVNDPDDLEARSNMHLASSYAGVGFGNAGVHLCHGLSYPMSGKVRSYQSEGYSEMHPLIPHGLSVVLTAPAVFEFTSSACPERHIKAAQLLGASTSVPANKLTHQQAGKLLSDQIREIMSKFQVPNGIGAVGFDQVGDAAMLTEDAMQSLSALRLSPTDTSHDAVKHIYEQSIKVY